MHDGVEQKLGEMVGLLQGVLTEQARQGSATDRIEERIGKLESKVTTHSVIGGAMAATAIGVVTDLIKSRMGL